MSALTPTDAATERMLGSAWIISASRSVIGGFPSQGGRCVPSLTRRSCDWSNRMTMKLLGPMASSSPVMDDFTPPIIAAMAITVATPITIPRMVSEARALLERSASIAISTPSRADTQFMDGIGTR